LEGEVDAGKGQFGGGESVTKVGEIGELVAKVGEMGVEARWSLSSVASVAAVASELSFDSSELSFASLLEERDGRGQFCPDFSEVGSC
jgi:hypothetical protein